MRPGIFSLMAFVLLFGACTPEPGPMTGAREATVKAEVAEALTGLTEAMNARDPEAVFAFYRQDESFYYLGCTSVLFGWQTFSSRVRPYYSTRTDLGIQREILWIQVLHPTVAVAALRGSSSEAEALFWTQVLRKGEDGRWLVTYEHESWPGCPTPRGPHLGTTEMPGGETLPPAPGSQGN
ncbi:MAG: nuclear transport factor 2 family protein [Longimicrobiales bacterium]